MFYAPVCLAVSYLYLLGDLSELQVSQDWHWGCRKFHGHCSFTYDLRVQESCLLPSSKVCVYMMCAHVLLYVCLPDRRPATCAVL